MVQAVLKDWRTAPISDKDKALYAYIEKACEAANTTTQADVDAAKAAGWTDEALYDAATVCALFQFYNLWIDATGVHEMPAFAHELSGHRLATEGYARES